jgi:hypothetical protein
MKLFIGTSNRNNRNTLKIGKDSNMKLTNVIILISILLLNFVSCNSNNRYQYIEIKNDYKLPQQVLIRTPHIFQNDQKSCATTSVAMAVSYYLGLNNAPIEKEKAWLISESKEEIVNKEGNDMFGLKKITDFYGLKGEYKDNITITDLKYLLANNILVSINIKISEKSNATHMFLVCGYDDSKKVLYINDPANPKDEINEYPMELLKKQWKAYLSKPKGMSHQSGYIIYPKEI